MPTPRIRASVVCVRDNRILGLRHSDGEDGGFWGVPGGLIEEGETPLDTALRETREESGYRVQLLHDPELVIEYDFVWQNHSYWCRTHWFAVEPVPGLEHSPRAGDVTFITGLRWFPAAQWRVLFSGYPVLQHAVGNVLGQLETRGVVDRGSG